MASETLARFSDTETASGAVRVEREPNLDYQITDNTQYGSVDYQVAYQVEWVSDFDRIEIQVENLDKSYISGETFTRANTEGVVSYPSSGSDGGAESSDTYRFTFRVYRSGSTDPVIRKVATDNPDGADTGEGDFGNGNSSELEWAFVEDTPDNSGASYDLYYQVVERDEFSNVRIRFKDTTENWGTRTRTSENAPNGHVTYSVDGTGGHSFDIAVEVLNQNGLVVDSTEFTDVADGSDPEAYGDPVEPDSPKLDSFVVTDNTDGAGAKYSLSYQTADADRFGGAKITFENADNSWATETTTTGQNQPDGTVSYSTGGTNGDRYEITVEVLETRNGVTFPVDSGTLEDVADGSGATWPEDTS
ncbi:hypothetical protein ACFQL4_14005 [Halosimplex aquaticum]